MEGNLKVYLSAYHSEVTGSRLMLVAIYPDGTKRKILIDCGYFQEIDYRFLNYEEDMDPSKIDAILITHNHIDHTGLLPKFVKEGYQGPIYMTEITKQLLWPFLNDAASQQDENASYMKLRNPSNAHKYHRLYEKSDVDIVLKQSIGVEYQNTIEILPNVYVTFLENGHLLGSSCILVQFKCYKRKPINFLFTGDYRSRNPLFYVPYIPKIVKNMELIIVCESTYGNTCSFDIEQCFEKNIMEAFQNNQHILIGAFAQGRMQELLKIFKNWQDAGKIPENYEICIDGKLGITTCSRYERILKSYYPNADEFLPKRVQIVSANKRSSILEGSKKKIIITTSGMLSNGPAQEYVPMFVERSDAMIHLCGYAAEETVARNLLEKKNNSEIKIGGKKLQKHALIKTTREFSSHAKADELVDFLKQFKNVRFVVVNHGATKTSNAFAESVIQNCPNVEEVGCINRQTMYCFVQKAKSGCRYTDIDVKLLPAKLKPIKERIVTDDLKASKRSRYSKKRRK